MIAADFRRARACFRPLLALCCVLGPVGAPGCASTRPKAPAQRAAGSEAQDFAGKLPEGVAPRLYDVHLTLDPNATEFQGVADVAIDLLEPHAVIVLHADALEMERIEVHGGDGRGRTVRAEAHPDTATLHLAVDPPLPSGVSSLHFVYRAPYASDLAGIYRVDNDGRSYVFSQFQPIAARRAFPCFDEPRFKAPIQMTLSVPEDAFAATNAAPVAERHDVAGQKTVVFEPTPPLPTYLVAVAVGPLDVAEGEIGVSPQRAYPVPLRGLATRGNGGKFKQTLTNAGTVLQALESYVDLPYPFAKLDLAAVPDFAWGAMENAGLVTFRDWLLLIDGERAPYGQRRIGLSVLSHELTHQWFGDWVTMPWWDDLWLNEAFATWRGQRTAHRLRPGMQFDLELVTGVSAAMHHDGLMSARRVREPCRNKHDIAGAADVITYLKGAGILQMFDHFVGSDKFRDGVRAYLKRFPFASADSTTFLTTVAEHSGQPGLAEAMQTFLDQPGVPEVSFAWRCEQDRPAVLRLSQDRWRPLGSTLDAGLWAVPVCFRYGSGNRHQRVCTVLREPSQEMVLHGGCPQWFVANADGAGYYRSRLEDPNAEQVAARRGVLSPAEWSAAIDNAQAGLRSGALEAPSALAWLELGLAHDNPRIARQSLELGEKLRTRYLGPAEQMAAQAGRKAQFAPLAKRLASNAARLGAELSRRPPRGSAVDALNDALGEVQLALAELDKQRAIAAAEADVRDRLAHQGALWLDGLERSRTSADRAGAMRATQAGAELSSDGVELALAVAGERLGAPFVARLVEALGHEAGGEWRKRLVLALGGLRDPQGAERARALALEGPLHANEIMMVLAGQLAPGPAQADAWAFVHAHVDALLARLPQRDRAGLVGLGGWLCDAQDQAALSATFAPRLAAIAGGARSLAQATESIEQCVAEMAVQGPGVRDYFLTP